MPPRLVLQQPVFLLTTRSVGSTTFGGVQSENSVKLLPETPEGMILARLPLEVEARLCSSDRKGTESQRVRRKAPNSDMLPQISRWGRSLSFGCSDRPMQVFGLETIYHFSCDPSRVMSM